MAMGHKGKNQYLGRPVKKRDEVWGHEGQGQRRNREDLKGRETEARAPGKKEGAIAWPESSLGVTGPEMEPKNLISVSTSEQFVCACMYVCAHVHVHVHL